MRSVRTDRWRLVANLNAAVATTHRKVFLNSGARVVNAALQWHARHLPHYVMRPALELYDLDEDQDELVDVAHAHPEVVRNLSGVLWGWMRGLGDGGCAAGSNRCAFEDGEPDTCCGDEPAWEGGACAWPCSDACTRCAGAGPGDCTACAALVPAPSRDGSFLTQGVDSAGSDGTCAVARTELASGLGEAPSPAGRPAAALALLLATAAAAANL